MLESCRNQKLRAVGRQCHIENMTCVVTYQTMCIAQKIFLKHHIASTTLGKRTRQTTNQ